MAYNSDGYIMIDFTEVDFRRTNQTIEGLFDRCQKVIGTNKFVIVINANNKTPLPSTVCITNGQYVIESVLYTFAISSNDNLHITKKTTPEELIDDNHVTLKTTFSSDKIMSLVGDNSYSTEEHVVSKWIDGTPVYEKTIILNNISGTSYVTSALGLNINKVINFFSYIQLGFEGSNQWITSPYIESANYRCDCHYQSADDKIYIKSNWGVQNAIITLRYTKS